MPYNPTTWVQGSTALNATHMNNLETIYTEATLSIEQDLLTAFVLSGGVCAKNGVVANQLDVTSCTYFALQTDNTLRRRAVGASTAGEFLTSTPSSTYYLDYNPDGTTSFATSHSGTANYLPICQLTTDGGGNINVVTDKRPLNSTLLSAMTAPLLTPPLAAGGLGALAVLTHNIATYITVTDNASHPVCSATAPATGLYRISGWVRIGNSGTATVTYHATYGDGINGAARTEPMAAISDSGVQFIMNGATPASGITFPCLPLVLFVQAGQTIALTFQDSTGTPSDQCLGIIERVA